MCSDFNVGTRSSISRKSVFENAVVPEARLVVALSVREVKLRSIMRGRIGFALDHEWNSFSAGKSRREKKSAEVYSSGKSLRPSVSLHVGTYASATTQEDP